MKSIFSFFLFVVVLSGCAKKREYNDVPGPKGANPVVFVNDSPKYLALGDSYTIGQSIQPDQSFPYQLAGRFGLGNPTIVATTGWTTSNLMNAIDQGGFMSKKYGIVTLLIGVNDQFQGVSIDTYSINFEKLLKMAITLANGNIKRVFVLSIPDYSVTPFAGSYNNAYIAAEINKFNEVNKRISLSSGVTYIDITDISRRAKAEPDLLANDGLHPSAKMYSFWVQRLESPVRMALSN